MVTVSYLVHYDTLLQNVTDIITKCDGYFITKFYESLLQNASGFLLQNATVIANCVDFISKCNNYCKVQRSLKNVSVHTAIISNNLFVHFNK